MDTQKVEKNGDIGNNVNTNIPSAVVQSITLTLDNCLIPKEKIICSPSVMDGLDENTETELRINACELIQTAGYLLKLPQVAMATGQVLFQRFYYSKSFVRHSSDITAMGCVCLASKIEEAPRRIRDVINVFHHIRQVQCQKRIEPLILDQQYIALKTQVIKAERRILKELGFCVHVKHPHKLIMLYLQILGLDKKHPGLLQMSWNYMNDALRTNVFVEYPPETVACACIYLSARKLRISMPTSPEFYEVFEMREDDITSICKRIVRLYKRSKVTLDELEDRVKELRFKFEKDRERNKVTVNSTAENTPNGNKSSPNGDTPTSITEKNHIGGGKRSRSSSKPKSISHSNSGSISKSGSSSSSSSTRNYKLDRLKEYRIDRKSKKILKDKSNTPSPFRSHSRKKYKNKHQDSPAASRSYNNERYKYRDNRRDEKDSRNRDYYRHYDYNNKKKHNKR